MHVIVVSGGPPDPWPVDRIGNADLVIAADSGYDHARAAGMAVDVLVGDLDSVSDEGLEHAERNGVLIIRHRPDKDATDLTLALELAVERGANAVTVVASPAGRLDHLLAGLLQLPQVCVPLRAFVGDTLVTPVNCGVGVRLHGTIGDPVTLVPLGGPASGVRTTGLLYPLHGETLEAGTTRGVSNQLVEPDACVSLESGSLLAIQPPSAQAPDRKDRQ